MPQILEGGGVAIGWADLRSRGRVGLITGEIRLRGFLLHRGAMEGVH